MSGNRLNLPDQDREDFKTGFCHALALALEEEFRAHGVGTAGFGVFLDDMDTYTLPSGITGGPYHVFLLDGDGHAIDIDGRRPLEDLMDAWGHRPFEQIERLDILDWMMDDRLLELEEDEWARAQEVASRIFESLRHEYRPAPKGPRP